MAKHHSIETYLEYVKIKEQALPGRTPKGGKDLAKPQQQTQDSLDINTGQPVGRAMRKRACATSSTTKTTQSAGRATAKK